MARLEAVAVALVVEAAVEAASGLVVVVEAASLIAVAVEVADAADSEIVAVEEVVEAPQTAAASATLPARRSPSRAPVFESAQTVSTSAFFQLANAADNPL